MATAIAIAIGILAAAGLIPADAADGTVLSTELGENAAEAALIPGMTVIPATSLTGRQRN